VAPPELSKAAYRNRSPAATVHALSAFKESGDIEYGVSLAVVLVSRQGASDLVDAAVVKNRLGPGKPEFMLKLVHDRADVVETSLAAMTALDPLHFLKEEIVSYVTSTPVTKSFLAERVGGNRAKAFRAIDELLDARKIFQSRQGIRQPLPGDPGYEFVEAAFAGLRRSA
jgi:hypothetical protein